ncbi:hypothetical protein JVW25_15405, partial [Vibrio cholerae O1]
IKWCVPCLTTCRAASHWINLNPLNLDGLTHYVWNEALYFAVVKAVLVLFFTSFGIGAVASLILSTVKEKLHV